MKIRPFLTTTLLASTLTISLSVLANSVSSAPTAAAQTTNVSAPTATAPAVLTTTAPTTSFTQQQAQDIQKIVHDYLVSNPQVLVEASQALQKQTEQQEQQYAQTAIQQNVQQLFNDSASPVAGNTHGTITLVEFFDYQCGHCKAMNTIVQKIAKNNANLRIVFKELPIFGDDSQFAAKAALASVKQNKYLAFHDALLKTDNPLNNDKVFAVAKKVGLTIATLKKDMNDPAIQAQLRANFKLAQALHLIGTPTFVIGNKTLNQFHFVPGATTEDNLQGMINDLAK